MSTIFYPYNASSKQGSFNDLKLPVPSCPKLLLPQAYTFPSVVSPSEQLGPDSTLTILSGKFNQIRSELVFPYLLPTPFIFDGPCMKTFPSFVTIVVDQPVQDTCLILGIQILVGLTSVVDCLAVSEVLIFLNELILLFKPHKQAYPFSVTAQMCSLPQLTCTTFSIVFTLLGMRTFKFGG